MWLEGGVGGCGWGGGGWVRMRSALGTPVEARHGAEAWAASVAVKEVAEGCERPVSRRPKKERQPGQAWRRRRWMGSGQAGARAPCMPRAGRASEPAWKGPLQIMWRYCRARVTCIQVSRGEVRASISRAGICFPESLASAPTAPTTSCAGHYTCAAKSRQPPKQLPGGLLQPRACLWNAPQLGCTATGEGAGAALAGCLARQQAGRRALGAAHAALNRAS